jgi:hypothetical protein
MKIWILKRSILLLRRPLNHSRNISRFFKERPNDDLVGLCEKYVEKLKKLVDECEQLFNRA